MNYGEIKQNIISLGFAEESDYEEFEDLGYTYDALNRSITQIAEHFPYQKTYEIEFDDTDEGIAYFDMQNIDANFLRFGETPVLFEKDGEDYFKRFSDFEIENKKTIVISTSNKGSYRIYYEALPTQITKDTPDTFVPDIPLTAHHLIPLLTSYYLWLDDDERKAVMYKNDFDEALAVALQKTNEPRATVEPSKWGDI